MPIYRFKKEKKTHHNMGQNSLSANLGVQVGPLVHPNNGKAHQGKGPVNHLVSAPGADYRWRFKRNIIFRQQMFA
jgi:hypothetical protein